MSVPRRMRLTSVLTPVSLLSPTDCTIAVRSYSPKLFPPIAIKRMETRVVKPRPPIWMRQRMTTCPKVVQCSRRDDGRQPRDAGGGGRRKQAVHVVRKRPPLSALLGKGQHQQKAAEENEQQIPQCEIPPDAHPWFDFEFHVLLSRGGLPLPAPRPLHGSILRV